MIKRVLLSLITVCAAPMAWAEDCVQAHVVQDGDTVFSIAETYFGDHQKWSLIYYGNQGKLNGSLLQFAPGTELNIPCLPNMKKADATPLQQDDAEMKLLTGSNYAPFTDRDWFGQGIVTELVNAALENTPNPVSYSITWEDDWSKHLFPKLDGKEFDMGFPWLRPDCEKDRDNERCANFHFSDPLVELLILVFTRTDAPFTFDSDADIHGKTLCRPAGYFTHDLDRDGREWRSKQLITLVQAESPDACFELLMQGKVDGVTINEFLGWTKVKELGLKGAVEPLKRPLSIEGLHVIISKKHWRGTTHLYRFNAGLQELKKSTRYDEIVSKHLGAFWSNIE